MKSHRPKNEERRQGPDKVCTCVNCIALTGWFLAFIAVIILYAAKPAYYWDRTQQTANPNTWNTGLAQWYFIIHWITLVMSCGSIWLNKQRVKRKTDAYSLNLIILAMLSMCSIIGYLFTF